MARQLGASISASVPGGAVFREEACPQQDNGFDCGMYVVAIAKELCSRWDAREGAGMVFDLPAQQFSGTAMRTLRGNILRLILDKITLQQRNNE